MKQDAWSSVKRLIDVRNHDRRGLFFCDFPVVLQHRCCCHSAEDRKLQSF